MIYSIEMSIALLLWNEELLQKRRTEYIVSFGPYYPAQNTKENVMDLMVIMGIVLVLMETIMVSTGM